MNYNVTIDMEGRGEFSDYIYKKLAECKREYTSYCAKNKEALQPINMMVSNENHKWMGGISSELYWNWLEINDCWVYEQYRGQGIGTELLRTVENMARKRGADYAMLTTFEQRTKKFYEGNGYKVVGEIKDYLPGTSFYTLKKTL
ncbi:N-acetyltransferase [Halobacillus sp. Marseille-P3879]|uniref:GNAT family N-acetyltransferase n=1 Tax=Halobacillus sp. Marseille-P3879 TaxID=2045014 RepID=UPI000C7CEB3B|nr:GNAT family N-acetyltransferase [Halobacillus sp. Marseille-P3879]